MGYVPDERLSRMFEKKQVTFFEPPNSHDWFHLFLIHQNLESRGSQRTFRLDLLPNFLDLVIWGHEHECKIDPAFNAQGRFHWHIIYSFISSTSANLSPRWDISRMRACPRWRSLKYLFDIFFSSNHFIYAADCSFRIDYAVSISFLNIMYYLLNYILSNSNNPAG